MHELSLAAALLPVVLQIAETHEARVAVVTVQAGELSGVVPESLALAFAGLSEGTLAAGAQLRVETVPVTARCRRCQLEFTVADVIFVCPACGVADVQTLTGVDLVLRSVELIDED